MRQPKPYLKKSHRAFYVNIDGRPVRLATEAEGEAKAYEKYYKIMAGRQPLEPDCPVAAILERFLDHHKRNSAPATYRFYERPVNSFARFIGPKFRLASLKTSHACDWIDTLPPASDTYRRNQIRAVKAAFKWAERRELTGQSPIRNVEMPPARPRDVYLMPEQWDKLVSEVGKSRDGGCLLDVLTAMKETGCRPQEVRLVEAHHLDGKSWVFPVDESKGKRESRIVLLALPENSWVDFVNDVVSCFPETSCGGRGDKFFDVEKPSTGSSSLFTPNREEEPVLGTSFHP